VAALFTGGHPGRAWPVEMHVGQEIFARRKQWLLLAMAAVPRVEVVSAAEYGVRTRGTRTRRTVPPSRLACSLYTFTFSRRWPTGPVDEGFYHGCVELLQDGVDSARMGSRRHDDVRELAGMRHRVCWWSMPL
jgi:hypothetical protein